MPTRDERREVAERLRENGRVLREIDADIETAALTLDDVLGVGHWLGYAHDAYRRVDKVTDLLNEYVELKYPNGIGLDEDGFLLWAARQCYQEAWSLLRSAEELARLASGGDSE